MGGCQELVPLCRLGERAADLLANKLRDQIAQASLEIAHAGATPAAPASTSTNPLAGAPSTSPVMQRFLASVAPPPQVATLVTSTNVVETRVSFMPWSRAQRWLASATHGDVPGVRLALGMKPSTSAPASDARRPREVRVAMIASLADIGTATDVTRGC